MTPENRLPLAIEKPLSRDVEDVDVWLSIELSQ
jgi:hypothetical protein